MSSTRAPVLFQIASIGSYCGNVDESRSSFSRRRPLRIASQATSSISQVKGIWCSSMQQAGSSGADTDLPAWNVLRRWPAAVEAHSVPRCPDRPAIFQADSRRGSGHAKRAARCYRILEGRWLAQQVSPMTRGRTRWSLSLLPAGPASRHREKQVCRPPDCKCITMDGMTSSLCRT